VWSHLTSDFAFDSLLANGSRISIRLPQPCLSYMICCDERNLLLCNFSSPATSTEAQEAGQLERTDGRPSLVRSRSKSRSGSRSNRGSPHVRACRLRAPHVPPPSPSLLPSRLLLCKHFWPNDHARVTVVALTAKIRMTSRDLEKRRFFFFLIYKSMYLSIFFPFKEKFYDL